MRLAERQVRLVVADRPDGVDRGMQAMMGRKKLDLAALRAAFEGKTPAPR
jgi:hypothetical protein